MSNFEASLEQRLLRYVQVDTESDEKSPTSPSTAIQFDLLKLLKEELIEIGAADVVLTDAGVIYANVPATPDRVGSPTIALLAHVDTAQSYNGYGVKPIVHRNYDGSDIVLPDDPSKVLSPKEFPYLGTKVGQDIITASGKTLLGADDKSGVAIIMTLAEHLLANPSMSHGPIRICLTPDEEIGRGVKHVSKAELGADFGYTLDGGALGELTFETFSADKATISIEGVSIHTGTAYKKLVNALHIAAKIINALPQHTLTPETTHDREGFIHVASLTGNAAKAEIMLILRDFDLAKLEAQGALLQAICAAIQAGDPRAKITCTTEKQYRNMRYWLEDDRRAVDLAVRAMQSVGIEPKFELVRGGTDGSQMTEKGVPMPNLFTGMQNLHGPLEWICVQDMAVALKCCLALVQLA
ncbi:MAG: peptidase T [Anaerolineae bacterium]|nr:peptidase T [Anaerolineae bacterium]